MLPGVAIVVTNEDTGVFREVVTNPNGTLLRVADRSGTIPGHGEDGGLPKPRAARHRRRGRTERTTLDLTLDVGALAETITVPATRRWSM